MILSLFFVLSRQVTLASLVARLNDTRAVSRVMTYTALAAETEVIENLREVLDGLQVSKTLQATKYGLWGKKTYAREGELNGSYQEDRRANRCNFVHRFPERSPYL